MTITPGRYRHYKGNEYEVLYIATHSETLEPMVVYKTCQPKPSVWVRPAAMFIESVLVNGITIPRFESIS